MNAAPWVLHGWAWVPRLVVTLGLLLSLSACSSGQKPDRPSVVRIAVLPDESEAVLRNRYDGLVKYLAETLQIEVVLKVPNDYSDLLRRFGAGEVDVAYFGGVTFVQANTQYQAEPLVMRDVDLKFTTYFIARPETAGMVLKEFAGRAFAFGSELSTSGHFMPRYFLDKTGIRPEHFFAEVHYSGSHDQTAYWVRDGRVDMGVANSEIVDTMLQDGRLQPEEIRVVWETPPYTDYVWAVRPGLDKVFTRRLRDAFLGLSPGNASHQAILKQMGAGGFVPASIADFARLRDILAVTPQRLLKKE